MDIKETIKRFLIFLFSCSVAAGPLAVYLFLQNKHCGDSLMYSADKLWPVVIISVLSAGIVWLVLKRPLYKEEESQIQQEDDLYVGFEDTEPAEDVDYDNSEAMEEYPELFSVGADSAEAENAAPSYYETLFEVMASEKREYVPEKQEESVNILSAREILAPEESLEGEALLDEGRDMSIYENIPMDLPEGYVGAKVYDPLDDKDEQGDKDEGGYEVRERRYPGETVVSKVIITAVFTLFAFLSAFLFSMGYTLYERDGVTVAALGKEREYPFADAVEYIVSPSVFGDRLSVEMIMGDGKRIELLPSGLFIGERFFEEYDSVYEYAAVVCEKMNDNGAQKTVHERKTIEGEFFGTGEKTEEYIKRIID